MSYVSERKKMKLRKSGLLLLSALMLVPVSPYAVQAETDETELVSDSSPDPSEIQKTTGEPGVGHEETDETEKSDVQSAEEQAAEEILQNATVDKQTDAGSVSWKATNLFRYGDGTPENPYEIYSKTDFLNISEFLKENPEAEGYCFKQMSSLDFSGVDYFRPVGSVPTGDGEYGLAFNGTYDGDGNTIRGISAPEDLSPEQLRVSGDRSYETRYGFGLFLQLGVNSKVCNLKIWSDVNIPDYRLNGSSEFSSPKVSYGILAAYAAGTIESVELRGSLNIDSSVKSLTAGSLVGSVMNVKNSGEKMDARIHECRSEVNISIQQDGSSVMAGGLTGFVNEVSYYNENHAGENPEYYSSRDNTVIDDSFFWGKINLTCPQALSVYTGGILAYGQNFTIRHCAAKVDFLSDFHSTLYPDKMRSAGYASTNEFFGGAAGTMQNARIQDCFISFKAETVHKVDDRNGPVNCNAYSAVYAGGLAGNCLGSEITNCYVNDSCERTDIVESISQGSTAVSASESVFHRVAGRVNSLHDQNNAEYPSVLSGNTISSKCVLLSHPFDDSETGESTIHGKTSYEDFRDIYNSLFPERYNYEYFYGSELFELYTPLFSGEGTQETPYLISSAEEAQLLLNCPFATPAVYFRQTEDIDLNGSEIGGYYFGGYYDGQNHCLDNATVKPHWNGSGIRLSIFGRGDYGQVKDLTINNPALVLNVDDYAEYFKQDRYPCVYVGTVTASSLFNAENVHVNSLSMDIYESGTNYQGRISYYCGGLAPANNDQDSANNCSVNGEIRIVSHNPKSVISVGGLLGNQLSYGGVTVDALNDCTFDGTITAEGAQVTAAGLVARQDDASVRNCAARGSINVTLNMTDASSAVENGANTAVCAGLGAGLVFGTIIDSVSDMDISVDVRETAEDTGLIPEIYAAGLSTVGYFYYPRTNLVRNSLNLSDQITVSCPDSVQPKIKAARVAVSQLNDSYGEANREFTLTNNRSVKMTLNDQELNSDIGPDGKDGETVELFGALDEAHERFPQLFKADGRIAELESEVLKALEIQNRLDLYKQEGQARFLEALAQAQNVLEHPDEYTQEGISSVLAELRDAAASLILKTPGDPETLKQLVSAAETLDLSLFTASGQQEFSNLLGEAEELLDTAPEQEEIDQMARNLHTAFLNLRLKADENLLAQLTELHAVLVSIEEEAVPAASRELFRMVRQTAEKALSDPDDLPMEDAQKAADGYEKLRPVIDEVLRNSVSEPSEDHLNSPVSSNRPADASDLEKAEGRSEGTKDQKQTEKAQTKDFKTSQKNKDSVRTATGTGCLESGITLLSSAAALMLLRELRRKRHK